MSFKVGMRFFARIIVDVCIYIIVIRVARTCTSLDIMLVELKR
jgi:hypothetical protein